MTYYQKLIKSIDSTVNAKGCEGFMRIEHGTLDALSRKQFEKMIREFKRIDLTEQSVYETYA
jgi:hypothetical protein